MEQRDDLPPIKTKQYPGRPSHLRLNYAHGSQNQPDTPYTDCAIDHISLRAAYRCARQRKDNRPLFVLDNNRQYIPHLLERPVGPDELTLNNLRPADRKTCALRVDLQVREIPGYEGHLKQPQHCRAYGTAQIDQACYAMYWQVRRTLQTHNFYTTPPPNGAFPNEYTGLLPIEQVQPYQEIMDQLVEEMVFLKNSYNEQLNLLQNFHKMKREDNPTYFVPEPLPRMLSYSLEIYP